jgi:hypothetical protein
MLRYDKGFEVLDSNEEAGKLEIEADSRKIRILINNDEIFSVDYTSSHYIKFTYPLSWKSRYAISDFISSLKMWKNS